MAAHAAGPRVRPMDPFNVAVAALGALVLALGLVSKWLEQHPVPVPLLALLVGVGLGPVGLGLLGPDDLGERAVVLEKVTRLVLAVGLVSVALRVPKAYPRTHGRTMAVLLGLGMPLMWAASTAVVAVTLGTDLWLAALIGAIVTATDPIAAAPIVVGPVAERTLPERLRHAISFESGSNDGLAYPFVLLPLAVLTRPEGQALGVWLRETVLWGVGAATALGLALGWAAGRLLQHAEAHDRITGAWRLVYTVALSLLAAGAGRLVGSDELLVVFAAGAAFVQIVGSEDRQEEEHGQEAVNRFFSVPIFAVLGLVIPWAGWARLGWSGVALAAGVLVLRRPPVLLLLRPLLPGLGSWRDALFMGWFGPVAVAALYYASLAEHRLGDPLVWDAVTLVVCASVVAHGVSAVPLSRLYARAAERSP